MPTTRTARANARLARATPAQRRVLIAKDVLAQIQARRLIAQNGSYLSGGPQLTPNTQIQESLKEPCVTPCHACAIGSLFLGTVRQFNDITPVDLGEDYCCYLSDINNQFCPTEYCDNAGFKYLARYFSEAQLRLMETAFEGFVVGSGFADVPKPPSRCAAFHKRYSTPRKRLIAIMRNIIRNKGTFKP